MISRDFSSAADHASGANGAGTRERGAKGSACAVCDLADARALTTTMLTTGARIIVCANHALMHERAKHKASSITELVKLAGDRRDRQDRRDGTADELGARLIAAFAGDRRKNDERRAGSF